MKRLFYIIALAAAAVACENTLDYKRDDIENQLTMNAQMSTDDSVHVVHLSISEDLGIGRIAEGSVRCFVNGSLVAEGTKVNGDEYVKDSRIFSFLYQGKPSTMRQTSYAFKASFKPGDQVRIEAAADNGKYSAWSEVTVPQAPQFHVADTLLEVEKDSWSEEYQSYIYRIRLKGKDIGGEKSYFRVSDLKRHYVETIYDENGIVRDEDIELLDFYKGNDPILNEGAPSDEIDITGASENLFNVFTDNLFRDKDFNMTLSTDAYRFFFSAHDEESYSRKPERYARIEQDLRVTICGITQVEYNYLKAMSLYQYNGGSFSFMEPVSFPDNVEGGVGVVSISTPRTDCFAFKTKIIEIAEYIYDE